MTEQERKVLERDAGRTYPSIAFKLGKIVAIDEILSTMDDAVQQPEHQRRGSVDCNVSHLQECSISTQ